MKRTGYFLLLCLLSSGTTAQNITIYAPVVLEEPEGYVSFYPESVAKNANSILLAGNTIVYNSDGLLTYHPIIRSYTKEGKLTNNIWWDPGDEIYTNDLYNCEVSGDNEFYFVSSKLNKITLVKTDDTLKQLLNVTTGEVANIGRMFSYLTADNRVVTMGNIGKGDWAEDAFVCSAFTADGKKAYHTGKIEGGRVKCIQPQQNGVCLLGISEYFGETMHIGLLDASEAGTKPGFSSFKVKMPADTTGGNDCKTMIDQLVDITYSTSTELGMIVTSYSSGFCGGYYLEAFDKKTELWRISSSGDILERKMIMPGGFSSLQSRSYEKYTFILGSVRSTPGYTDGLTLFLIDSQTGEIYEAYNLNTDPDFEPFYEFRLLDADPAGGFPLLMATGTTELPGYRIWYLGVE